MDTKMTGSREEIMPPPWLAYPDIERYSIGWRMGCGEAYMERFSGWLDALSPEQQAAYQAQFPEPVVWKGWWEQTDPNELLPCGAFYLPLWRPEGTPRYTLSQLQQAAAGGQKHDFCFFWKPPVDCGGSPDTSCFSQWQMSAFRSMERTYCCMEQYMMAQKAALFKDPEILQQILACQNPRTIKALGQKVRRFDQTLWDKAKYTIVLNGNWCKFSQNRALRDRLLATQDCILAEASPYDTIWGIGLSAASPDAQNPLKWRGQNLLGFALMEVRDELRRVTQNEPLCDAGGDLQMEKNPEAFDGKR